MSEYYYYLFIIIMYVSALEWGNAVLGHKRTLAESHNANLLLLKKEKMPLDPSKRLRIAVNGLVDDPNLYDQPDIDYTRLKRCKPHIKHIIIK